MLSQSKSDIDFLAQVPEHIIIEFRSYAYQKDYVVSNPRLFHMRHWVDVPVLRAFISQQYGDQDHSAYVLDLSDARYNLHDKFGQQYSVDALIKNKDRDSWGGTNGKADSLSQVLNVFGPSEVVCRRSRLTCQGIWACERADPNLINVTCGELDPDANHHLIEAQVSACKEEGTTPISAAIAYVCVFSFFNHHLLSFSFFNASHSSWKCESGSVLTGHGKVKCDGKPMMWQRPEIRNGKQYFLWCSKWRKDNGNHLMRSIPQNVDEAILSSLFHSGRVAITPSDVVVIKNTAICLSVP
ncbi:hypothetical protein BDQ17DRAFT_1433437 [Cyathus striatus]|nr:hypothetical protein BDQ17DRAFT_1433437 [Cyathus striatus]